MNPYIRSYSAIAQDPELSPVELLEMLRLRDEIQASQDSDDLSSFDLDTLSAADLLLFEQADLFATSLSSLVDLERERSQFNIPARRWWWFLDVIRHVPSRSQRSLAL